MDKCDLDLIYSFRSLGRQVVVFMDKDVPRGPGSGKPQRTKLWERMDLANKLETFTDETPEADRMFEASLFWACLSCLWCSTHNSSSTYDFNGWSGFLTSRPTAPRKGPRSRKSSQPAPLWWTCSACPGVLAPSLKSLASRRGLLFGGRSCADASASSATSAQPPSTRRYASLSDI